MAPRPFQMDLGCWKMLEYSMFLYVSMFHQEQLCDAHRCIHNAATSGRPHVGDNWELWEPSGKPHPEVAGRKHLGNHIWKTSGDICETIGRRGSKVPGTLPHANKAGRQGEDEVQWETQWKTQSQRETSWETQRETSESGDKVGDKVGDKAGETQWETQWETK